MNINFADIWFLVNSVFISGYRKGGLKITQAYHYYMLLFPNVTIKTASTTLSIFDFKYNKFFWINMLKLLQFDVI